MMRFSIVFGAVAAVCLIGCADLSKYTKEATGLASELSPQVGELMTGSQALVERAQKLPAETSAELLGKVTANHATVQELKAEVDGLPGRIDQATKGGDAKKVSSLLAEQKDALTTKVAAQASSLKELSGEVATAEAAGPGAKSKVPGEAASDYSHPLASGYVVKGASTGLEAQLVAFIEDKTKPVDKTTWFNFDRLQFKTGSAELEAEKSKDQLANLAEILKAFPKVKLKIGGYTDNQGAAAANKKLSLDRAKAVVKALTGLGAAAARLSPEGYGPEHPVCAANDTEECRAQNRRIAVRVAAK
jgi:outer membrane protein OmpA-like peptidoglycan-associated protein